MSAPLQRSQHQHIVESAGCAHGSSADVMACLRKESMNVLGRLWLPEPKGADHAPGTEDSPSWQMDNIFDLPRYNDGLRMPGLAVVDGDVLREPVKEAYKHARNDVPVIFSSMAQECGGSPGENVSKLSPSQFASHLADVFSYMNSSFGYQVADLYANVSSHSTQLEFDTIAADIEMTCGNLALARAAGQGFRQSPVYLVYNEMHVDDVHWANHGSDLMLATQGEGPSADALRDAWYEFASTGQVSAWQPVSASKPWVTVRLGNAGVRSEVGWKQEECNFWRDAGFGSQFWWSN